MFNKTSKFIADNWEKTVRYTPLDNGDVIGLPNKYTVPCVQNNFQTMFYWDTYFTNLGLINSNNIELAKNNCDNLIFLANKFGFVPNGNRVGFLKNSQPPYLAMAVNDIYNKIKDKIWLKTSYGALLKEYNFWMTNRITKNGLNRYGTDAKGNECIDYFNYVNSRIDIKCVDNKAYYGECYWAEGESGWDFSGRFESEGIEFNPVDLNSNLYFYELFLNKIEKILNIKSNYNWTELASKRKQLMLSLLWDNKEQCFKDYNYVKNKFSPIISCASFQPYFVNMIDNEKIVGLQTCLKCLEYEYGLIAAEKTEIKYQWGFPNGWAPLHYVAVSALNNYNLKEDSSRIAKKYCKLVDDNFLKCGHLSEKYNVISGGTDTVNEYDLPDMLGWSAGVFIALKNNLF